MQKSNIFLYSIFLVLILGSCSEEVELEPIVEIYTGESKVLFQNELVTRVITTEVVMSPEREPLSAETIAITINDLPLAQKRSGEWVLNYVISRERADGGAFSSVPECETEVLWSLQTSYEIVFGIEIPLYCTQGTSSTCFESYMEDGILVTEVTYSESVSEFIGPC